MAQLFRLGLLRSTTTNTTIVRSNLLSTTIAVRSIYTINRPTTIIHSHSTNNNTAKIRLHIHSNSIQSYYSPPFSFQFNRLLSTTTINTTAPINQSAPKFQWYQRRSYRLIKGLILTISLITSTGILLHQLLPETNPIQQYLYNGYIFLYSGLRLYRLVSTVLTMIIDYQYNYYQLRTVNTDSIEYSLLLSELHYRNARRLRQMMNSNCGVYIKFGQQIAQMKYLLPDEYIEIMQSMLDQAPVTDYSEVRESIKEELGEYPETLFHSFNPIPIASASLAQVHFAEIVVNNSNNTDNDSNPVIVPVAIKIQHRFLRHTVAADIFLVDNLVHFLHYLMPKFNYNWLADTMRVNLPIECDFTIEAANANRCASNFKDRIDIHIPQIYSQYSSKRILTMERMNGCNITNLTELQSMNINPIDVSELLSEIFSEMTFKYGFIHCDPHPGNLFIRRLNNNSNKPQLILLDHGLYRELSPEFRLNYAQLWRALILADIEGIKHYATIMNAGEMVELFAAMLTRKGWNEVIDHNNTSFTHLQSTHSQSEKLLMQQNAQQYSAEMQYLLGRIPIEFILLFKTNDCLRYIDALINSNNEFNSSIIMARYCIQTINQHRLLADQQSNRLKLYCINLYNSFQLEWRIFVFELLISTQWLINKIKSTLALPSKLIQKTVQQQQQQQNKLLI